MTIQQGSTVFVSGANGFIALHVVDQLLKSGYKVIGSVRSREKANKLLGQFSHPNLTFVIVPDISALDAFDQAFHQYGTQINVVIHMASPFHYNTESYEQDLVVPAVNGTNSILDAIMKYSATSVERVIITSSDAAVTSFEDDINPANIHTEESWNSITWAEACENAEAAYYGSKTFAERAAWSFVQKNRDQVSFELSTVNPVWVFGPQLFDESAQGRLNTSCQYINDLVHSNPATKLDMDIVGGYVDVRDVARAHIVAFESVAAINRRLVLCAGRFTLVDIADVLAAQFPQLKGHIASGDHPESCKRLRNLAKYNYSKTEAILGIKYRPFETTIADTAEQLLKMEERS